MNTNTIRVGVVGVRRGMTFARQAEQAGMQLVALCDNWEEKLQETGKTCNVATYTDYARFLEHEMDAVVLANYFHQHAPFAIKALQAGRHVLSECAACHTLGEGVALARAVERSGRIYMIAENYPYMLFNQEMRRLYREGAIGEFRYGEGEYVHPMSARARLGLSIGKDHWRNWIPATYYCTHAVAPIMYITDTRPVMVNGLVIPYDEHDEALAFSAKRSDTAGIIVLRMDNGALVKALQGGLRGHGNFVRIHGTRGLVENSRTGNRDQVRLRLEAHGKEHAEEEEKVYLPDWPEYAAEAAESGHSGGDFWTNFYFARAIRLGEQPWLDVYRAIDMSIVGIQAYRSALKDGAPVEVPDFRQEAVRAQYEQDDWSPDPERQGPGQPAPSVLGERTPHPQAKAFAREVWAEHGYRERIG